MENSSSLIHIFNWRQDFKIFEGLNMEVIDFLLFT